MFVEVTVKEGDKVSINVDSVEYFVEVGEDTEIAFRGEKQCIHVSEPYEEVKKKFDPKFVISELLPLDAKQYFDEQGRFNYLEFTKLDNEVKCEIVETLARDLFFAGFLTTYSIQRATDRPA